jgi:hypothetical protein
MHQLRVAAEQRWKGSIAGSRGEGINLHHRSTIVRNCLSPVRIDKEKISSIRSESRFDSILYS